MPCEVEDGRAVSQSENDSNSMYRTFEGVRAVVTRKSALKEQYKTAQCSNSPISAYSTKEWPCSVEAWGIHNHLRPLTNIHIVLTVFTFRTFFPAATKLLKVKGMYGTYIRLIENEPH